LAIIENFGGAFVDVVHDFDLLQPVLLILLVDADLIYP
jgi:hypothetical protein